MKLSKRILNMQESPVRKLVPYATEAKKNGKKVYHLNIGQPDIATHESFMNSIREFDQKVIAYANSQGLDTLVDAIIDYYKNFNINYNSEDVLITTGGSEALLFSIISICDPGDEVLVPEPFYTNYNGFGACVNVGVKPITTKAEDGFHLPSKAEIVSKITPKTKAMIFSNPGNPTGVVYTKKELEMLIEIAREHDLFIISDEVYREFTYDGEKAISMGTFTDDDERIILVDSVSKRYSACGARIGCITSKNREFMKNAMKLCQGRLCVATLDQVGATQLYKLPQEYIQEIHSEYNKRRDIVYNMVKEMDDVICRKPHGSFYLIAKLPVENAEDFVIWMLTKFDLDGETVMLSPAEGFYATPGLGKNEVRIAYMLNTKELERAMHIFSEGLKQYRKLH
ncbi:MAG: pyridoxal phosphate-dependent aminotransferase [Bacilli bacterium]